MADVVFDLLGRCWPGVLFGAVGAALGAAMSGPLAAIILLIVAAFIGAWVAVLRDPTAAGTRLVEAFVNGLGAIVILGMALAAYHYWFVAVTAALILAVLGVLAFLT